MISVSSTCMLSPPILTCVCEVTWPEDTTSIVWLLYIWLHLSLTGIPQCRLLSYITVRYLDIECRLVMTCRLATEPFCHFDFLNVALLFLVIHAVRCVRLSMSPFFHFPTGCIFNYFCCNFFFLFHDLCFTSIDRLLFQNFCHSHIGCLCHNFCQCLTALSIVQAFLLYTNNFVSLAVFVGGASFQRIHERRI